MTGQREPHASLSLESGQGYLSSYLWCIIDIIVVLFLLFIIYKQLISLTRKTFPDFSLRTFFNQKKNEEIVPAAMSTSERVQFLHQYDVVINLVISRLQEDDDDFGFHDFGNEFQREDKGYFSVNELPTDYPKEYEIAYYHGYTVFYPSTRITFSCQSEDASLSVHLEESEWRPMNYPPKPYLGTWFFRKGENMCKKQIYFPRFSEKRVSPLFGSLMGRQRA